MNPSASAYVPSSAISGVLARHQPAAPTTLSMVAGTSPSMTAAERIRHSTARMPCASTPPPSPSRDSAAAPMCRNSRVRIIRYTKQQLMGLRQTAMQQLMQGRLVRCSPLALIPESFAALLGLPYATEFLNVDAVTEMVADRTASPSPSLPGPLGPRSLEKRTSSSGRHCAVCIRGVRQPCSHIQEVLQQVTRNLLSTKSGATLMQPALVVDSLLRLALVFDAKQSSLRLRLLAEQSPRVRYLVEEYLCGEGYHLPLPPVTAHDAWATLSALLCFDAIRDNRTRIITDLSKHWKKRSTHFDQFVYFYAFRDARPVRPAKNIITQSVKPGMVAMLVGDPKAMLLLHHLGFFIPPDYYWSVFPFLRQALGQGTPLYALVRHLGLYFSSEQPEDMYNPVERPSRS